MAAADFDKELADLLEKVSKVLDPGGVLAQTIPHYEDRPEQRHMATEVARALAGKQILLAEAGTGTGKTLAYLIPSLLSGKRVVISTGTRTLQDQITRHDLPLLRELIDTRFSAVTLKGVSNYVCLRKLSDLLHASRLPEAADTRDFDIIADWAEHTVTGDRAEVDEVADNAPIWSALTNTPETRIGSRCPFYERCFITQARRRAEKADLIIVNHHLFFADLALRSMYPGARILPAYEAVIFDEAHQLEEVITEHFGVRVSTTRIGQLERDARDAFFGTGHNGPLFGGDRGRDLVRGQVAEHMINHMTRAASTFFALLHRYLSPLLRPDASRVELPSDVFGDPARQDAWFSLDTALDELGRHAAIEGEELENSGADEVRAEAFLALSRRISAIRDDLAALAEQSADAFVYWGELNKSGVFLGGSPIDVAPYLQTHLGDTVPGAVLTSATLTAAGSFDFVRQRLGLGGEMTSVLAVSSPFDYGRQTMLYVPQDLPEPREPDFLAAATERIAQLLAITEGRAFVLFTSHRSLTEVARRLGRLVSHPLFVQGQMPRHSLVEAFRRCPGAVLLGTGSFWEGVDVPGEALSMVIIEKLPFSPPTDPLTAARMRAIETHERDPFAEYLLPRAALTLKQGFGRLIRTKDDRGIVAILDRRVLGRLYGRVFLDTLPPEVPRTSIFAVLERWWQRGGEAPGPEALRSVRP